MAYQKNVDALLSAEAHDSPSEWVAHLYAMRQETASWGSIWCESKDSYYEERATECYKNSHDLKGVDLSGKIFNSRVYEDASCGRRILEPEHFHGAELYLNKDGQDDYYFPGFNFRDANLEKTVFRGCSFSNTNFIGVNAKNAVFAACPFTRSDEGAGSCFDDANLEGALFHQGAFQNVLFRNANAKGATFSRINFEGNYLSNGPMWYAFSGADLTDAKFLQCNLSKTGISREQLETCASIEGSILPCGLEEVRGDIEQAIRKRNMPRFLEEERIKHENLAAEQQAQQALDAEVGQMLEKRSKLDKFRRPQNLSRSM